VVRMASTDESTRPAPWPLRAILYRRPASVGEWVLAVVGATILYTLAATPVVAGTWLYALATS
jgi:hypothetical protein